MSTDLETTTPRSYASYTHPVWWRLLFSREAAVIAALVAVILWAIYFVPFFGNQLTMTFLLLDIAPIMLIALPMTLVIVTGEIDLSVASVVGLSSVLLGLLVDHGWAVPAAMLVALLAGLPVRPDQRVPRRLRRTPVAGGHDRHPRALPRHRRRAARHQGRDRLPAALDEPGQGRDRWDGLPGDRGPVPGAGAVLRPAAPVLRLRPRCLRHRPQRRGGAVRRRLGRPHQADAVRDDLAGLGVRRHLLHAAVLQQSRRQRDRPRAPGHRGRPAGRRLHLRRSRQASGRHRRRTADRGPLERAAPAGDHGQRHQHHHRSAADRLRDVHECPGRGSRT